MSGAVVPRPPEHQSAIKSINPIRLPAPARRIRVLALKNGDKFVKKIGYVPISNIDLFVEKKIPAVCTTSHNSCAKSQLATFNKSIETDP
jgi:hypothetical protein